jgi:hypothetical protein
MEGSEAIKKSLKKSDRKGVSNSCAVERVSFREVRLTNETRGPIQGVSA